MDIARPQWTFLERFYNILLYCLGALQIQFLISYWLNFIFFLQGSAHLLLTAGFPLCSEKYLNLPWASSHAILKFLWAEILLTSFSSTSWLGFSVFWSTSTPFKKECEAWDAPAQKSYVSSNTRPFYVTISLKSCPQIYQLQVIRKLSAEIVGHFPQWKDGRASILTISLGLPETSTPLEPGMCFSRSLFNKHLRRLQCPGF